MPASIGLNGFGRIGRYLVRLLSESDEFNLVCINARASNKALAHLLKYDSVHGRFNGEISYDDAGIIVNGHHIKVTRESNGSWKWKELGADIVIETSGTLKKKEDLAKHLECGAKKLIVSAPAAEADITIVMGANDDKYIPSEHHILSNASCTTNCLAPAAKIINDTFGIKHGLMTTIHSYTMSQRLLDGSHKDLRRGRSAALSMLPTSTGAAIATGLVIPALQGKLDGMAIRVPTPDVSLVDLTVELLCDSSAEEVNKALLAASQGDLCEILGYSDEPLVSCDYLGSTHGGVVDALSTWVMNKRMLKLILWYDNESGFTNQLLRLMRKVAINM